MITYMHRVFTVLNTRFMMHEQPIWNLIMSNHEYLRPSVKDDVECATYKLISLQELKNLSNELGEQYKERIPIGDSRNDLISAILQFMERNG